MKMEFRGDTLRVTAIKELGAANAVAFRDWLRAAMNERACDVEIDLSQTTFLDSCGIGALVTLRKLASERNSALRLVNPQPAVQQILELTRMDRILETTKT